MDGEQHKDTTAMLQRHDVAEICFQVPAGGRAEAVPLHCTSGLSSEMKEVAWRCNPSCCVSMVWAGVQGSPLNYRDLRMNPF